MASPVVHFEVRAQDPDAARQFFGPLFGWSFPEGAMPGYSSASRCTTAALACGVGPTQGGDALVTFFVGVADVPATLALAEAVRLGGKVVQPATSVPGTTFALLASPAGQVVGVASTDG